MVRSFDARIVRRARRIGSDRRAIELATAADARAHGFTEADGTLGDWLAKAIDSSGVPPGKLCFEASEEDVAQHLGTPFSAIAAVSQYGTLKGLKNIRRGKNIEIKPYVIMGAQEVRPDLQIVDGIVGMEDERRSHAVDCALHVPVVDRNPFDQPHGCRTIPAGAVDERRFRASRRNRTK